MKKISLIIFILTIYASLFSEELTFGEIEKIERDIAIIEAYFPRPEGSPNEKEVFGLIERRLGELNLRYTKLPFNASTKNHSFSQALSVRLSGKLEDTVMITIPVNHPYDAAPTQDGSVNIALGLALLERLSQKELPVALQINFMGAEFGRSDYYSLGSQLYLEEYYPNYSVIQLYLNFKEIPTRVLIKGGGTKIVTPHWMITNCSGAFHKSGLPFMFRGNENQIFRIGFNTTATIIDPYLARGIPSVCFEEIFDKITPRNDFERLSQFIVGIEQLLTDYSKGIPTNWDRHYLFFQIRDFYLLIDEQTYLIIMLIILCCTITYILIFTQLFKNLVKIFLKHFWQILLIFSLIFIYSYTSSLIIKGISLLRNTSEFWKVSPLVFLLYKICLIAFLFLISRRLISMIKFTTDLIFYSTAGIFVLFLSTLVIAAINISFTYYFLWAFLFFMLSGLTKNRTLKLLFFIPAPYWILKVTGELILMSQPVFSRILLLSTLQETLIISTVILPFILLSANIFHRFSTKYYQLRHTILTYLFGALSVIGTLILLLFNPFSNRNPQQVTARNIIDQDKATNIVEISSDSALNNMSAWIEDKQYHLDSPARKYIINLKEIPDFLQIKQTQTAFLDRKNINLRLKSKGIPSRISMRIESDKEFTLFDSNLPFRRSAQGRVCEILIGANPPNPLDIQITLPEGYSFQGLIEIEYFEIPFKFEFSGANKIIKSSLVLKKKIQLDT